MRALRNTPSDLVDAAETMRTGFPVLSGTEFEILYQANGFPLLLGDGERFNKGERFCFGAEHKASGKLVAVFLLSMSKLQRHGELVVIATHQDHQNRGIARALGEVCDRYFEECGAEMAYVWAAGEHTATQKIMASLGFVPRAVIPGYYRIRGEDGAHRRTIEVFMQKFYGGAEKMATKEVDLLPEVRRLVVPW